MKQEFELDVPVEGMPDLRDRRARISDWMRFEGPLLGYFVALGASFYVGWLLCRLLGWDEVAIVVFVMVIYIPAGIFGAQWLAGTLWTFSRRRMWVLVGADGVLLCQALSKPPKTSHRFLPYSAIKQIEKFDYDRDSDSFATHHEGAKLMLKSGQCLTLEVGGKADDLYRRLCEARDRCGEIAGNDAELLQRGDRSVNDWLNDLDTLSLSSHQGYRAPSISSEQLWRVIDAPSVNPTARAGAAFALLKGADGVDRERLLNTAKSAVAPGLDAAFEAIANKSSDEALANALAAVEEPALEAR